MIRYAWIGHHTLAEYIYTADGNNFLEELAYGNGDSVEYTYDDQGRVTQQTYEDGDTVEYRYDNSGALATVTDSATGITTTYYYDFTDRLMKYVETSADHTHSVTYGYDNINNLTSIVESIDGISRTTGYAYDDDNRVTTVSSGNVTTNYTYDAYGRVSSQVTKQGETTVLTYTTTYQEATDKASSRVATHGFSVSGFDQWNIYTYDSNGNITVIEENYSNSRLRQTSPKTTYEYDSQNQLIRENNGAADKTWVWTYDDAGNILSRSEYSYTLETLGEPVDTVTYAYGDDEWGDLLTSYDGAAITYDTIGNPLNDGTWTYTWEHGRELASMSDGATTWTYTYDANGMRTSRSNGTTTYSYVYNGDKLIQMTVGGDVLRFSYDAFGAPMTMDYNGTVYYYAVNLQGDVIAITNNQGDQIAVYYYDAWGNLVNTLGDWQISDLNPLRYRGYVYDNESGLYYLQSRYYNPEVGRFLNADAFASTGQGLLGNNMFAYCANNPVIRFDSAGKLWDYALDIGFVAWSAHDAIREPDDWKNWAALAVDVVFAVIPFVPSGVGQVIKVGNKVDNATDIVNAINKIDNIQDVTKATMIGRNMNRVTSAAGLMGITDNLYKVWTGYDKVSEFSKSLANALSAIHNGGWLFEKLRQGYTVFDIGLSTLHQSKGLWYGTERLVSALWETRNIWKLPLHLLP